MFLVETNQIKTIVIIDNGYESLLILYVKREFLVMLPAGEMEGVMKFSMVTISFFLMILFITHTFLVVSDCPSAVPDAYRQVRPGNVVAAYFGSWDKYGGRYQVEDIEPIAHILTHVVYAFAKPNAQAGTCDLSDPWADLGANFEHRKKVGGNFGKLLALKKKFPHLKILLSVGGGTYSKAFSEIAQNGKTDMFVASIVRLLDGYEYEYEHTQHGETQKHRFDYTGLFDGVDLDWEWTSATVPESDVVAYHSLVKKLFRALKKKSSKLILTSAIQVSSKLIVSLRLVEITPYVDWFNVMAYNYGGPSMSGVSMNAPICNQWSEFSIDGSLTTMMQSGVSPAKMVLGIPLYGHVYDKTQPKLGSVFDKTERTGAFRYDQIKDLYLDNPACESKWHTVSKVPYAYCPNDGIFVSYDDERSVKYKVSYARQKRLKGVFFWRLSGDDKDHSLIKSVRE